MAEGYLQFKKYRDALRREGYDCVALRMKYNTQKWHAIHDRNITWNLTFEEWCDIWIESGKLHHRGKGKGKYTMGRIGDTGPYEVGNVLIEPHDVNSAHKNGNPKCKPVMYNGKRYNSVTEAAAKNNTTNWFVRKDCLDPKNSESYYLT